MKEFNKGVLFILLSAVGFGLLPIFALFAYQYNINVTTLLLLRFLLATVLFFIYAYIKLKRISVGKRDLLFLFLLGGICYNLQSRLYFTSVQYIPSSLACLFLYLHPMIVTALSMTIDKEKITKEIALSIGTSFLGLILILGTSVGKINSVGILLALGAAFVYSIYIVAGNRVVHRISPIITSAFIALFSFIGILISGILTNSIDFHFEATAWFPIIGLVLFATVFSMLFFFRGLELLGPTKSSILSMIEPVATVFFSTIILHDRLTILQLIGGVLVIVGSMLVVWSREQGKVQEVQ